MVISCMYYITPYWSIILVYYIDVMPHIGSLGWFLSNGAGIIIHKKIYIWKRKQYTVMYFAIMNA